MIKTNTNPTEGVTNQTSVNVTEGFNPIREQEVKVNLLHQLRHMVEHLNHIEMIYRNYDLEEDVKWGHGVGTEIDIQSIRIKRDELLELLVKEIPTTNLVDEFYTHYVSKTLHPDKEDYYLTINSNWSGNDVYRFYINGDVYYEE